MTIDRRDFVKLGALSTLALAVDKKTAIAEQDAPVKPMASQAKPITREEYLQRQETARRYMSDAGIDAVFLTGGSSLQYFTNAQWGLSERLFALVFPAKGELAWVAPAFEKGRALEQIKFGDDVRTWQEDESPYQLVASILKDRGVASGRLGVWVGDSTQPALDRLGIDRLCAVERQPPSRKVELREPAERASG